LVFLLTLLTWLKPALTPPPCLSLPMVKTHNSFQPQDGAALSLLVFLSWAFNELSWSFRPRLVRLLPVSASLTHSLFMHCLFLWELGCLAHCSG
jgi:hypothetical protein